MKIRLYLDEDSMDHDLARALRGRGVDVITVLATGMSEVADEDQLKWATTQGRVLYSFNVGDFYHLHTVWLSQGKSHAGIILAPQQRYSVGEQMRRLLRLIAELSAEEMRDRVEFLGAWG
jgi:uncharacterized protein with PIN domain